MKLITLNISRAISLILLILSFPFAAIAQGGDNTPNLEKELKDILGKYVYLIGEIKPNVQNDPVRPFVQLFRNDRVQVFNDLDPNTESEMISVRDYGEKIKNIFQEGLRCEIDLNNIRIGKEPDNEGSRLLIEVKVKRTLEGLINGEPYRRAEKILFLIGFDLLDGRYSNFLIHGISPVSQHDHDLALFYAPDYSRIINSNLFADSRFEIPWELSWRTGVNYHYMFNKTWGLGSGINLAMSRHALKLDKVDPLYGHDPNFTDIEWHGELTYLEIPFYGIYNRNLGRKMIVELNMGGFFASRIFESIQNQGTNKNSGQVFMGIISDPFNYENISTSDIGIDLGLGLKYYITKRIGVFLKGGYRQGLMPLEEEADVDLPYSIYQGQYNPLFHKSGSSNYSQDFSIIAGFTLRIFGDKYFN